MIIKHFGQWTLFSRGFSRDLWAEFSWKIMAWFIEEADDFLHIYSLEFKYNKVFYTFLSIELKLADFFLSHEILIDRHRFYENLVGRSQVQCAKSQWKFDIHLVILATMEDVAGGAAAAAVVVRCECVNTTSKPQLLSRRASGKVWHNNCDNYRKEEKKKPKRRKGKQTTHSRERGNAAKDRKSVVVLAAACRRF